MPIPKIRRHLQKQKPFDWLAILVLGSFAFIVISIVDNDIQKFGKEMELEARHLEADLLSIKYIRR